FDSRTNVSELRADGKVPAHTVDTIARQAIRRAPHSRQVGFSITGPWRRSIEIGLTRRCPRHATRRVVEPLRRQRQSQQHPRKQQSSCVATIHLAYFAGFPSAEEPAKTFRPSARVTLRAFAIFAPSLAR